MLTVVGIIFFYNILDYLQITLKTYFEVFCMNFNHFFVYE